MRAAVHRQGVGAITECDQVTLETSGTITVIPRQPTPTEARGGALDARLARIEELLDSLVARRGA